MYELAEQPGSPRPPGRGPAPWVSHASAAAGLMLLFIAGCYAGFGADLSRDWKFSSFMHISKHQSEWAMLGLVQFWLMLIPGVGLASRFKFAWYVVAVAAGFALWLLLSWAGLGLDQVAPLPRRAGMITWTLFATGLLTFLMRKWNE